MIEEVVSLEAQLHFQAFVSAVSYLKNGKIDLAGRQADEGVSALIAEVAGARYAAGKAGSRTRKCPDRACKAP